MAPGGRRDSRSFEGCQPCQGFMGLGGVGLSSLWVRTLGPTGLSQEGPPQGSGVPGTLLEPAGRARGAATGLWAFQAQPAAASSRRLADQG